MRSILFLSLVGFTACTFEVSEAIEDTGDGVSEVAWSSSNGSDGNEDIDSTGDDTDTGDGSGGTKVRYYYDGDLDGFGDPDVYTDASEDPGSYYVLSGGDCDDSDAAVNPSESEIIGNDVDDDCNAGTADDGTVTYVYYVDADADGYGAGSGVSSTSSTVPSGYSAYSTDCNDASSAVKPGATETANGIDDDCDGSIDEGTTSSTCESTESLVNGSFTAPAGSTITSISGEALGSINAFAWQTLATGTPSGMTITTASNVVTFSYASCTADSSVWNMSVEYVSSSGTTMWDCESSAFTGTWAVNRDSTADTATVSSWGSGCDMVF